jgi:hypothetical protein
MEKHRGLGTAILAGAGTAAAFSGSVFADEGSKPDFSQCFVNNSPTSEASPSASQQSVESQAPASPFLSESQNGELTAVFPSPEASPLPSQIPGDLADLSGTDTAIVLPDANCYSFDYVYTAEYQPINSDGLRAVLEKNAQIMADFYNTPDSPVSPESIVNERYQTIFEPASNDPSDLGFDVALAVINHVATAQLIHESNPQAANAHMEIGIAVKNYGQNTIDFGTDEPAKRDKKMDKLIRLNVEQIFPQGL